MSSGEDAHPIPFLDLAAGWSELQPEVERAEHRVVESGHYVLGPEVTAFESEFAASVGVERCVGVGNGFDALHMVLRAWGIGPGDEVLVPALTAVATWMAVSHTGATPIGVDVDPATRNVDPALLSQRVGERTRAIVPVHLYGQPSDMAAIAATAEPLELPVLEDAAQAHGASFDGRRVGAIGNAAAFSFYPTKNLGGIGDGGAVTTAHADLADELNAMRNYGWRRQHFPERPGVNSRLDELQAALLRLKLEYLEEWNARRRRLAERYLEELDSIPGLGLPVVDPRSEHVWHLFTVTHDERDVIRQRLEEQAIGTLVHYPAPPHLTEAFGGAPGEFPVAERLADTLLSLPLHPHLTEADQDRVIDAVREAV